jgi:hypothetical protein
MVTKLGKFFTDRWFTFNKYWIRHDRTLIRRAMNKKFRAQEKQYFMKFRETLRKSKSRGWTN